jgi:transcriptional regulator
MLRGIVGFRFDIARLEGKWKMNQNRELRDRAGTAAGLEQRGQGEDAQVAAVMREQMPAK